MNSDATMNLMVIEVMVDGELKKLMARGPTRDAKCSQQVWQGFASIHQVSAANVRQVYSEWEFSIEDKEFIEATFGSRLPLSYSFDRPASEDDWDQALLAAGNTIAKAIQPKSKYWWQFWK